MFQSKYEKFIEAELVRLREELKEKDKQITQLQAALVSKEAPAAYMDHYGPKEIISNENPVKRLMDEVNAVNKFNRLMEGPLFENPDQAVEFLSKMVGPPTFDKSAHNNEES